MPIVNPIIFLDIDGVLNSHSEYSDEFREPTPVPLRIGPVQNLQLLLRTIDGRIVISSTWRTRMRPNPVLCPVRQSLNRFGIDSSLIIGRTGDVGERGRQILDWVRVHRPAKWVVLDDNSNDFDNHREVMKRFILVNRKVGLTASDVDKAIVIIG